MENELMEAAKTATNGNDNRRITLQRVNFLTKAPCAYCNEQCDPIRFDFRDEKTGKSVCVVCAEKYAPEMVRIKEDALCYAEGEVALMIQKIQGKVSDLINYPVEKRIMEVLEEINQDYLYLFDP
ncbi:MAG: hypothetical protein M0P74_00980 [Syntrophales bacterium]|jgi:hypothetical protein|nr:hypothetical protein [Syntrophales bacterium]